MRSLVHLESTTSLVIILFVPSSITRRPQCLRFSVPKLVRHFDHRPSIDLLPKKKNLRKDDHFVYSTPEVPSQPSASDWRHRASLAATSAQCELFKKKNAEQHQHPSGFLYIYRDPPTRPPLPEVFRSSVSLGKIFNIELARRGPAIRQQSSL